MLHFIGNIRWELNLAHRRSVEKKEFIFLKVATHYMKYLQKSWIRFIQFSYDVDVYTTMLLRIILLGLCPL
jgi:hypothetical protein